MRQPFRADPVCVAWHLNDCGKETWSTSTHSKEVLRPFEASFDRNLDLIIYTCYRTQNTKTVPLHQQI